MSNEFYNDNAESLVHATQNIEPKLYQVVMLNDDFTPMEFVVSVLEKFFCMERSKATTVMLDVHTKGSAVCGLYTKEVAETKISQVSDYAKVQEYPLNCCMESVPS